MMALFALSHLVNEIDKGASDPYIDQTRDLINQRYAQLYTALGIPQDKSATNTHYYALIDIYRLAGKRYGQEFRHYLADNFEQVDFLVRLAEKNGVVLVDGVGFGTKPGELRISLANLPTDDYARIGQQINKLLAEYHQQFAAERAK